MPGVITSTFTTRSEVLAVLWLVSEPIPESHPEDLLPKTTSDTSCFRQV